MDPPQGVEPPSPTRDPAYLYFDELLKIVTQLFAVSKVSAARRQLATNIWCYLVANLPVVTRCNMCDQVFSLSVASCRCKEHGYISGLGNWLLYLPDSKQRLVDRRGNWRILRTSLLQLTAHQIKAAKHSEVKWRVAAIIESLQAPASEN